MYQASLEALSSVTSKEILEFTSYRAPPAQLNPLFNTLCMLFDRDERFGKKLYLIFFASHQKPSIAGRSASI